MPGSGARLVVSSVERVGQHMISVGASRLPVTVQVRGRRIGGFTGFLIPESGDAVPTGALAPPASVGLHGLLVLQEAEAGAVQDRAAERHAESLLNALGLLQRGLLGGGTASVALDRLATMAQAGPTACDPRLAAVVRAVTLRAAIEAARQQCTASDTVAARE